MQGEVQFVYDVRQGPNAMLSVAITGTLSVPRKEAAALIDCTSNARFHPDVSYQTNYLRIRRVADECVVNRPMVK